MAGAVSCHSNVFKLSFSPFRKTLPSSSGEGLREGADFICYNLVMKKNADLARELRKNQTPQEKKVWDMLRNHQIYGYEFRRQYPIGDYIVDFICREKKIIIELDGGQHNEPENIDKDKQRTTFLENKGYTVLRFWNNEVDNNIEGVYEVIKREFDKD